MAGPSKPLVVGSVPFNMSPFISKGLKRESIKFKGDVHDFDFEILIEDTASQPSQVQSNDDVSSESESEKEEE